ncbi:MAG: protein kinase, partial [Myxococcales bacterium]|nr:protein kinase [Myxococcales bacterium]
AKVVDFGLVKDIGVRGAGDNLSVTDALVGTPLYMAPEAIKDPSEVGPRADLYALGAVGYFLLTGKPPFLRTVVEICSQHLHTQPEPLSARLGAPLPDTLEELVMRCLSKSPDDRPQTAMELRELLEACEDVPTWSAAEARAWWAAHGAEVRTSQHVNAVSATAATLAVDLGRR